MEEYINQIEQFLRGQMNPQEEITFKASLASNMKMRLFASIVTYLLRAYQKNE
jgi:hypothetical protein